MSDHKASQLTHKLSSAPCSIVVHSPRRKWWLLVPVVAVLVSGAGYALYPPQHVSNEAALLTSLEALKRDNQRLEQDVKLQTMNFQHEQAVRESLERELATQGEVLKKAQKDLAFFRTNAGRVGQ